MSTTAPLETDPESAPVLIERRDLVTAELLMREALAMQRRLLDGDQEVIVSALANLAYVLRLRSDPEGAEPLLREALEMDWVADPSFAEHYRPYAPPLSGQYFNLRKTTIYAGSSEIQKNIISQLILGL